MSISHLYSNESYDESESWCNPGEPCTPDVDAEGTRDPGLATCTRCLSAAASYGDKARSRMMELQSAEGVRERHGDGL